MTNTLQFVPYMSQRTSRGTVGNSHSQRRDDFRRMTAFSRAMPSSGDSSDF